MNESNGGRSIKSSFSGLSVRLAKTKGGRKTMRAALYMATVTSVRYNSAVKPFYKRIVEKGKAKKLALILTS
ncbi:transposase [Rickettsia sp. Tenjiku01]|uniref:transposase n=1 Tax=Rickettsia sp. Tenjiku01 TaxID=1736693 RepID=UPI0007DB3CC0|nr:transposase [Rickettsia sp. Tenjiku01]